MENVGQDLTEDDLIKMAIEESMKTHKQENKDSGENEEAKNEEKEEDAYLAEAFSLNDKK